MLIDSSSFEGGILAASIRSRKTRSPAAISGVTGPWCISGLLRGDYSNTQRGWQGLIFVSSIGPLPFSHLWGIRFPPNEAKMSRRERGRA